MKEGRGREREGGIEEGRGRGREKGWEEGKERMREGESKGRREEGRRT